MGVKSIREATYIGHENGAAQPSRLQGMDDLVRDIGVIENAGRDVNHARPATTRADAHPAPRGCHGLLHSSSDMLAIRILKEGEEDTLSLLQNRGELSLGGGVPQFFSLQGLLRRPRKHPPPINTRQ